MNTTTAIVEYSETEAGLTELRSRIQSVVYDVTTNAGMEAARKDRRECVTLRTSLDKLRLKLNADDQARIKYRNGRAQQLEAEITALEAPIDEQIRAEEARKEAEKQARIDAERERINAIRRKISDLGRAPVDAIGSTLAELQSIRVSFQGAKPEADEYQELLSEATGVWTRAGEQLDKLIEGAERVAAEEKRQAEARAVLEEQQRRQAIADREAQSRRDAEAKAAREQQERDDAIAKEARDREDREAKARRDAQDKAAAEQRARDEAEAKAVRDAEEKRIADERAEVERVAEENRNAEAERVAKAAKAEAEKRRKHTEQVNARLAKFRQVAGGNEFIKAALDYRSAEQDQATEKLVDLCELYAKRAAKTPVVGQAA